MRPAGGVGELKQIYEDEGERDRCLCVSPCLNLRLKLFLTPTCYLCYIKLNPSPNHGGHYGKHNEGRGRRLNRKLTLVIVVWPYSYINESGPLIRLVHQHGQQLEQWEKTTQLMDAIKVGYFKTLRHFAVIGGKYVLLPKVITQSNLNTRT